MIHCQFSNDSVSLQILVAAWNRHDLKLSAQALVLRIEVASLTAAVTSLSYKFQESRSDKVFCSICLLRANMTTNDPVLLEIFTKIPERDQTALLTEHRITNMAELVAKKSQLQQRALQGVCAEVQLFLEHLSTYLEELDSPATTFTWEGFMNFCGYVDTSGGVDLEDSGEKKKANDKTPEKADPDGRDLTAEERKQLEQSVENDPLTMLIRGFSSPSLQFEFDVANKTKNVDEASEKVAVAFNGNVYYVNKCYNYQQPSGKTVTVGIRKFTKNEKKAICALVVPFHETVMGPGLEEVPPIGVPATYEEEDPTGVPEYVQVYEKPGLEPIVPLSSLQPCATPSELPKLLFEPQQTGQPPHNFGFVYEQDGKNRVAERDEFPFIDLFSGSGGFHQGVMQVPGFKGVAAVEWWDTAW